MARVKRAASGTGIVLFFRTEILSTGDSPGGLSSSSSFDIKSIKILYNSMRSGNNK